MQQIYCNLVRYGSKQPHQALSVCTFFYGEYMIDERIIKILFSEANKAFKKDEIPVGAVVVKDNRIISSAHNNKQRPKDVTGHAEIIAIKKAAKKLKDWRLEGCKLYVTLEPCNMCKEVIRQSRINEVYYLTSSNFNSEINKEIAIKLMETHQVDAEKYLSLMQKYFKSKR